MLIFTQPKAVVFQLIVIVVPLAVILLIKVVPFSAVFTVLITQVPPILL